MKLLMPLVRRRRYRRCMLAAAAATSALPRFVRHSLAHSCKPLYCIRPALVPGPSLQRLHLCYHFYLKNLKYFYIMYGDRTKYAASFIFLHIFPNFTFNLFFNFLTHTLPKFGLICANFWKSKITL